LKLFIRSNKNRMIHKYSIVNSGLSALGLRPLYLMFCVFMSKKQNTKFQSDDDGGRTVILLLPKDFIMEGHSHIYNEQHFVLKGQYEIGEKVYSQGTYQLIQSNTTPWAFYIKDRRRGPSCLELNDLKRWTGRNLSG